MDDDYDRRRNIGWLVAQERGGYWARSLIVGDSRFGGMGHGIGSNYASTIPYPSVGVWHHGIATYRQGVTEGSFVALDGAIGKKVTVNQRDGTPEFNIGGIAAFGDTSHSAKALVKAIRIYETGFDGNAARLAYESMRDNLL